MGFSKSHLILLLAAVLGEATAQVQILGWNFDSWSGTTSAATTNLVGGTPSFSALGTGITITTNLAGVTGLSLTLSGWSTSAVNASQGVMFSTSSSGYSVTSIQFSQRISSTAPFSKVLQYSSTGTDWTDAGGFTSTQSTGFESVNIAMPSGASNLANLYFRIVATTPYSGSMGSGGNFRIDNLYGELYSASPNGCATHNYQYVITVWDGADTMRRRRVITVQPAYDRYGQYLGRS